MPVLASCDDEPPEPLIDCSRDYFCSVVFVEVGATLPASPSRPSTARANLSKRKVKARELCPLRSFILFATFLGQRHGFSSFSSFASLWRSSARSLQYKQPYWDISRAVRVYGEVKPIIRPPLHPPAPYATLYELHSTSEITMHDVIDSATGERSFSIPRIVVTPPAGQDLASFNQVFTPQDAGHGNLLTVPDPDLEVINQSGHARTLFDSPYLRRERLYSFPGACKKARRPPVLARKDAILTCVTRESSLGTLQEDEDEALDLGPTWSG